MKGSRGFSLLELLVVVATIMVIMAIAIPAFQDALVKANTSSLSTDGRALYIAINQYYADNGTFPPTSSFDVETFEPLSSMGYYTRPGQSRLKNLSADGYFGDADEFWLEMTLRTNYSIRFLVANSAAAPMSGGTYQDGVFLYLDGVLTDIGKSH